MTNKPFVLADIKDLINQLDLEEISMSRLVEILNEKADAASEDEAVGFSRFLYYGTWQTIGDNGEDMLYKSYATDEEKFASELYQLYQKSKQKQAITDIMNDDERDGLYDDKNENNNQ